MDNTIVVALISGASAIITATIAATTKIKINKNVSTKENANFVNDIKFDDTTTVNNTGDSTSFDKQRLDKLYIPFYKMYVSNVFPENNTMYMKFETAQSFLKLFEDNIIFMGHESQELVKPYQIAFYNYFGVADDKIKTEDRYNFGKAFLLLTDQLFDEYSALCKSMNLPLPAKRNYLYKEDSYDD